jgi:hypothetical protein
MANDFWRRAYGALRLRVLNVLARLFGLLALIGGAAFLAWATYLWRYPELPRPGQTLSGSVSIDYLGTGVFCLAVGIGFLAVRPYRPDVTTDARARRSWWTGEPR